MFLMVVIVCDCVNVVDYDLISHFSLFLKGKLRWAEILVVFKRS